MIMLTIALALDESMVIHGNGEVVVIKATEHGLVYEDAPGSWRLFYPKPTVPKMKHRNLVTNDATGIRDDVGKPESLQPDKGTILDPNLIQPTPLKYKD